MTIIDSITVTLIMNHTTGAGKVTIKDKASLPGAETKTAASTIKHLLVSISQTVVSLMRYGKLFILSLDKVSVLR